MHEWTGSACEAFLCCMLGTLDHAAGEDLSDRRIMCLQCPQFRLEVPKMLY